MATPRPFGVGPYGAGWYSRYRGTVHELAGVSALQFSATARAARLLPLAAQSGITFDATAKSPQLVVQLAAASGIVFDARSLGITRVIHPQAISEIVFSAQGFLAWTWDGAQPCAPGAWPGEACGDGLWSPPADPCAPGGWSPLPGAGGAWQAAQTCHSGNWSRA